MRHVDQVYDREVSYNLLLHYFRPRPFLPLRGFRVFPFAAASRSRTTSWCPWWTAIVRMLVSIGILGSGRFDCNGSAPRESKNATTSARPSKTAAYMTGLPRRSIKRSSAVALSPARSRIWAAIASDVSVACEPAAPWVYRY